MPIMPLVLATPYDLSFTVKPDLYDRGQAFMGGLIETLYREN